VENKNSLISSFTYGTLMDDPSSVIVMGANNKFYDEIVTNSTRRGKEMISLLSRQIDAQNKAAERISESNDIGSHIVAQQIQEQTQEVLSFLDHFKADLSDDIHISSGRIINAVGKLGSKLSIHLTEISWQLAQQTQILEGILFVLQENRNNEARQLVSQGLRLYLNDKYRDAEERFRRALDYDMTDYQVLMNMGYIEIHKNNIKAAFSYFHDALSLPSNLDNVSSGRALAAIGRLYYTQKKYEQALSYSNKAIKYEEGNASYHYASGIYAALSRESKISVKHVKEAILIDPSYFVLAATERELDSIRAFIDELLVDMAKQRLIEAKKKLDENSNIINNLINNDGNSVYFNCINSLMDNLNKNKELLKNPSYSVSIDCIYDMDKLYVRAINASKIIPKIDDEIRNAEQLKTELSGLKKDYESKKHQSDYLKVDYDYKESTDPSIPYTIAYAVIALIITGKIFENNFWHGILALILFATLWLPVVLFFILRRSSSAEKKANNSAMLTDKSKLNMTSVQKRLNDSESQLKVLLGELNSAFE